MKKIVFVVILILTVLVFLNCKLEKDEYTIIFESPKNNEIITNETQEISIIIMGSKNGTAKVFLNNSLVFKSEIKEKISFNTTVTEGTNILETIIEKDQEELKREKIQFIFKKQTKPKPQKVIKVEPRYAKIKKYKEVIEKIEIPKIEEIKESRYISSIELNILNENETGYFKDNIKLYYKVEFFDEFKTKALEYLKKVSLEITDPQDNKLLSETLKEPGLTLDLDVKQLPSGIYTLTIRAEDINNQIYESSKWIKIDKTPPSLSIEGLTNDMVIRGTLYFSIKLEDESGIKEFYSSIETKKINYKQGKNLITFIFDSTKFQNGKNQITIYASDKLNNDIKTNISVYIDNWHEEVVDQDPGAGFNISSFLDEENNIYLAYYNINKKNLYFAKLAKNSSKWYIEVVDKEIDSGKYPSIFIDKFKRIHISYTFINPKWDDEDLRYALKEYDSWKIITLDQQDKAGRYTSITVDDRGIPHISYYNYSIGSLRYITYNLKMDRWEVSVPDSYENVGSDTCIGLHN
ncbi:MAG: Ig-like domain-containing protein, partial [Brevinematia bacterium]